MNPLPSDALQGSTSLPEEHDPTLTTTTTSSQLPDQATTINSELEATNKAILEQFAAIKSSLSDMSSKMDANFAKVDANFAKLDAKFDAKLDKVDAKIAEVNTKVDLLSKDFKIHGKLIFALYVITLLIIVVAGITSPEFLKNFFSTILDLFR